MNIAMFLSLFLCTMSVVVCALVKQWCQEYKRHAYPHAPPHKRGRVRTFLFNGLEKFQLRRFILGVHVALHISVFLFFWAVSDLLYNVYQPVGNVARYCLLTSLVVYAAISISPLIFINSPYHTALTLPIRGCGAPIFHALLKLLRFIPCFPERYSDPDRSWLRYFEGIRFNRTHYLLERANESEKAEVLDKDAMKWLLAENYLSDTSMDKFLESLPGYIHSHLTTSTEQTTSSYIIERIREHVLTCTASYDLSDEACITRVSACVNSLWLIFTDSSPVDSDTMKLRREHIQGLVDDLNARCDGKDWTVTLRASCVRALVFQGLLMHFTPPDVPVTPPDMPVTPPDVPVRTTPTQPFPDYLRPLYTFLCCRGSDDSIGQQANSPSSTEARDPNEMWKALLNDGPLVNLKLLADVILSQGAFHPQSLPLCWVTLDTLLKEFGIARMDISRIALAQFDEVLKKAHHYHQKDHRGFRIMPLLETLDTVDRGRHLSMVFQDHPKYYGRADVVFGKEQLRNSHLMEAFASCLPGYIAKTPQDERRYFMEVMVCNDGLWNSLQVNLWKAVHLESSVPDKQRIFNACCTVIDAMFLALEDSDKVNWRSPEFGTLAQHFELFVATCFKGTFIGRATGFRVGLIKLRFCDALLTKFRKEVDKDDAVTLQSQWDVASLARVFYTLEVGGERDMEFWKNFTSGGDTGADFIQNARKMLDATIRDGPLLNFCKLSHLAVTAVPFAGSGLGDADIEKVQGLQMKVLTSPLDRTSIRAWRKLNRLEDEVRDAGTQSSDKEKDVLEKLLLVIREAKGRCPFSAQQLDSSPDDSEPEGKTPPPHSPASDDTSTHHSASARPGIRHQITSDVVRSIEITPFTISPPRPPPTDLRQPSWRITEPANLPGFLGRAGVGVTADAGRRLPTLSDDGSLSQPTSLNGPDITLSTLHELEHPASDDESNSDDE